MRGAHSRFQRYSVHNRAGLHHTRCFLGVTTACPVGTTKLVPGLTGAVILMGVSVSLSKAVSGSSAGGMIDPRETHNNPRITIVPMHGVPASRKHPKTRLTSYAPRSYLSK